MFSNRGFNALLKTLEEPPPHVKFLLAADPRRWPVLSRCLQLNLRRLLPEEIRARPSMSWRPKVLSFGVRAPLARPRRRRRPCATRLESARSGDRLRRWTGRGGTVRAHARNCGDLTLDLLEALAAGRAYPRRSVWPDPRVRRAAARADCAAASPGALCRYRRRFARSRMPRALAGARSRLQLVALDGPGDLPLAPIRVQMVLRALAFRPAAGRDAPSPRTQPSCPDADARRQLARDRRVRRKVLVGHLQMPRSVPSTDPRIWRGEFLRVRGACCCTWRCIRAADCARLARGLAPARCRLPRIWAVASQIAHHCDLKGWTEGRLSLRLGPCCRASALPGCGVASHAALEKTMGTTVKLRRRPGRSARPCAEARARVRRTPAGGGLRDGGGPGCARCRTSWTRAGSPGASSRRIERPAPVPQRASCHAGEPVRRPNLDPIRTATDL